VEEMKKMLTKACDISGFLNDDKENYRLLRCTVMYFGEYVTLQGKLVSPPSGCQGSEGST
jgi:hypothetical protein